MNIWVPDTAGFREWVITGRGKWCIIDCDGIEIKFSLAGEPATAGWPLGWVQYEGVWFIEF